MAEFESYSSTTAPLNPPNLLYPIAVLWGIVLISLVGYFAFGGSSGHSDSRLYLLPWCFLAGAVIASPAIFLWIKGRLDPFNPLIFAAWSYFLPAFFVGGLLLAFNLVEPYYLVFVEDERFNLSLALVYVMLGYGGLIVGFALPLGRAAGERVSHWLPEWNCKAESIPIPGLLLLGLGLANTLLALTLGMFGYQRAEERGIFDGALDVLSQFWIEAGILLWLYIFRTKRYGTKQFLIITVLLVTSFARSAFQGNRAAFLNIFILIAFAFVLSGRKITRNTVWIGAVFVVIAVIFGMIYGTTFRAVKGDQQALDANRYADTVSKTFEKIGDQDLSSNLIFGFETLGERIEAVSPLSVIVANYEKLAPSEELFGISNNIWTDTAVVFIPRILWPDKPVGIEPGKYAELYFNYGDNSFAITPMGDLLRNFGPFGVPLGMIVLGILIRTIYTALQENKKFAFWRAALYYMILTSISYEGTYGLILPTILRVGAISIVGLLILRFFAGSGRGDVAAAQ